MWPLESDDPALDTSLDIAAILVPARASGMLFIADCTLLGISHRISPLLLACLSILRSVPQLGRNQCSTSCGIHPHWHTVSSYCHSQDTQASSRGSRNQYQFESVRGWYRGKTILTLQVFPLLFTQRTCVASELSIMYVTVHH